jgi:hypothetical protein
MKSGHFCSKTGRFLAKNGAKRGVCSYYLINRVKLQTADTVLFTGNLGQKTGCIGVGGVGVADFFGEEKGKGRGSGLGTGD